MRTVRRLTVVGLALALAATSLGAAGVAVAEEVEVTGSILVANPSGADDPQCISSSLDPAAQGTFGWAIDTVTPGNAFTLQTVTSTGVVSDFDISFYPSVEDCEAGAAPIVRFAEVGDEAGIVPAGAGAALVIMWVGAPGSEFVYRESVPDGGDPVVEDPTSTDPGRPLPTTVVAVIDSGFSPYHFDFVGHQHPWNTDADPDNDLNFYADPASYIEGHPGAVALPITIPTDPNQDVSGLAAGDDADVWAEFQPSSLADPKVHWFPGTKIVGALSFETPAFYANNDSHGTRSAASAAGNLHGTCPECLFVLVNNSTPDALAWVAAQPWIDVVTNSYGHSVVGGPVRDNVYFGSPVRATRAAADAGQTIVFSAGNGLVNAFDVPMFTYWSSEKGPDWMVTVGAVDPDADQTYSGAGKPVDISSYGRSYPSTGGTSATGTGEHSGTSNAAPTVAGTIARVIQQARELLGDTVGGHADGVVARAPEIEDTSTRGNGNGNGGAGQGKGRGNVAPGEGTVFACGDANAACALADGVLTAVEARQVVFENVLPSELAVTPDTVWPSTEYAYYYQGHGVVFGRLHEDRYAAEQQRFLEALTGVVAPYERPVGEQTWMAVDSKCRQRLWGSWSGGYFDGSSEPAPSMQSDFVAWLFDTWCSQVPQDTFLDQTPTPEGG